MLQSTRQPQPAILPTNTTSWSTEPPPGGITAAIAAAREGASVVLLEQTRHVGGLSTSGLNRDEGEHMDRSTFGGLSDRFTIEAARRSGTDTEDAEGARIWESHIAEQVFLEMLKEANVPVHYEQLLEKVEKTGTRITKLQVRGGTVYEAKVFIDATYEGDLMAAAGVSYTVGREGRDTYDESKAGVRYMDDKVWVSPYDDEGNLLFGVMPGEAPAEFSASEHPICYNVRLNLTADPQRMVPIKKPANYDPKQHELLARCIEAGYLKSIGNIIGLYRMPGSLKRECNNRQFSFVSMSIPGAQTAWAEATFEEREKIHQQYRDYTHGQLWFLKSDERVPQAMRDDMSQYGFCKDEWQDNDHWPWYLYIRAARRMEGSYILTQADVVEKRKKEDVIHIGSHYIDSHHVTRYAVDKDHFINGGRMWQAGRRFDIPYRAITPRAEECENLLVPVSVSASNVAFAAIRLEPTWMHLGEVSGMAAVLAISENQAVQDIDIKTLQSKITGAGMPLEWEEAPEPEEPLVQHPEFGALVFEDEFDREESQEETEELGNDWITSTEHHAPGHKQADLRDGYLFVETHPEAAHTVSVRQAFPFKDGTIEMKVKFNNQGDALKINLTDYDEKSSGANLVDAVLKPTGIRLEDLKTGQSNLNIQVAKRRNALTEEQKSELAAKRQEIPHPIALNEWHHVFITVSGDRISCIIDGEEVGSLRSPGIAHETKTFVRLQVHRSIAIDDVKFWQKSSSER
ncbi:FAD-dependent oxidoreductase [bacterium]|nr:FAD-dependent oxidoreductase [bacterium]